MQHTHDDTTIAQMVARVGGQTAMRYFRQPVDIIQKGDDSPVTIADKNSEQAMRDLLSELRPNDAIYGEEMGGQVPSKGRVWVLDPIDGTRSFITGNPNWGVLVGLVVDGVPQIGACYIPYCNDMYHGQMGVGAWCNGQKLMVNPNPMPLEQYYTIATDPKIFSPHEFARFEQLGGQTKHIRYQGDCAGYCWAAMGMPNIICEAGLKIYDFVALAPITIMAGLAFTDWQGQPLTKDSDGRVICCPPQYHQQIIRILNQ